jgi:hypothetical protein
MKVNFISLDSLDRVNIISDLSELVNYDTPDLYRDYDQVLKVSGRNAKAVIRMSKNGQRQRHIEMHHLINNYLYSLNPLKFDSLYFNNFFSKFYDQSFSLCPARDHPFQPLKDIYPFERKLVYDIEMDCCNTFIRLFDNSQVSILADYPLIGNKDSIIMFGSQISNYNVRQLFGMPFTETDIPQNDITYQDLNNVWSVNLRWNLFVPPNSHVKYREQYKRRWAYMDYSLFDFYYNEQLNVKDDEDYLLITSIPKSIDNNLFFIIFYGLHGPGTRSTVTLFSEQANDIFDQIYKTIGNEPYFQILIKVNYNPQYNDDLSYYKLNYLDSIVLDINSHKL